MCWENGKGSVGETSLPSADSRNERGNSLIQPDKRGRLTGRQVRAGIRGKMRGFAVARTPPVG